ncbi:DUF2288 family protein [Seongchinamella sediminis]|uniref:DUF2288 family protein n=2 Tax=Seongchinamella sediminis TaxID=2283635 RepID=A0A3L7DXN0_9GAMM|nr:DUF2288 family protein [Seongchinamella sediminis]
MRAMAEAPDEREALLRQEYLSQTARINWHDLQTYYAHGNVISVAAELDLVEVAVQLGLDNTAQFQQWIADQQIAPVQDAQALAWYEARQELWAVVAPPWVLVQQKPLG